MATKALILVLIGSVMHIAWNAMTKAAKDKFAFLWWAILASGVIGLATYWPQSWSFGDGYYFIAATIIIHALYFWMLTQAYKFADLSFVYPYCRGIGTMVATLGGIVIFNELPSWKGTIGIILTLGATMVEPVLSKKKKLEPAGIIFTILTGILIASYLLTDKGGLKYVEVGTYLGLMLLGSAIVLIPIVGKRAIIEIKHSTYKPFIGTFFLFGAYFLILKAMALAPISYVVAARASGIVISGIMGIVFFKEQVTRLRWLSIILITIGVYFIGTA